MLLSTLQSQELFGQVTALQAIALCVLKRIALVWIQNLYYKRKCRIVSKKKNAFDIRSAIKMDIFKDEYQPTENKACQMSNKCGILNLTFPNVLVFQRLLFFMNVLNRIYKLYEKTLFLFIPL